MATFDGPKITTSGLILSLDAADKTSYPGSGTSWKDLSGNDNNGTLTNGPTFSAANRGNIVFDGVDDYVVTSNFTPNVTNKTLSGWVKLSSVSQQAAELLIYKAQMDQHSILLFIMKQMMDGDLDQTHLLEQDGLE